MFRLHRLIKSPDDQPRQFAKQTLGIRWIAGKKVDCSGFCPSSLQFSSNTFQTEDFVKYSTSKRLSLSPKHVFGKKEISSETIWSGTWSEDGTKMIRIDLARAGIEYTDANDDDLDFHALRHRFISDLANAGASLRVAQELARHSKPG